VFYKLISSSISHTYPEYSDAQTNKATFIVFTLLGAAEVLGGVTIGKVGQMTSLNLAAILQNNLQSFTLLLMFLNCFLLQYWMCLVIALMWYPSVH
jgi:hypothetical protein